MASIYARGLKLWMRVKERGEWTSKPTPYAVGQEEDAKRYAAAAQKRLTARAGSPAPADNTLRGYALGQWLDARRTEGHEWAHDRGRLEKHVLPVIGDMRLDAVRPVHLAALVRRLRFEADLAPRTVRNVYAVVAAVFRDAAIDGRIEVTPCVLTVAQLGRVVDKDPEWRPGALFDRREAEQLISDPRIPLDRRVVYAIALLAGLRPGEGAALRWRHYDPAAAPLGRLLVATSYSTSRSAVKRTKTETVKAIPVHPALAALLAEWHRAGWAAMMDREPGPDDLIVPVPPATAARRTTRADLEPFRGWDYTGRRWREVDLPMLGWRARSVYDCRATFITLAIEDGADEQILRDRITHTKARRDAFDGYNRGGPKWEAACREVAKLRIRLRPELPRAVETEMTSPVGPHTDRAPRAAGAWSDHGTPMGSVAENASVGARDGQATSLATAVATVQESCETTALSGSGGGSRTPDDRCVDPCESRCLDGERSRVEASCDVLLRGIVASALLQRAVLEPRSRA